MKIKWKHNLLNSVKIFLFTKASCLQSIFPLYFIVINIRITRPFRQFGFVLPTNALKIRFNLKLNL